MADRMAARIEFGGDLSETLLDALVDVTQHCGAGIDWGERADRERVREAISAAVIAGEPLVLVDDEATWGRFEELEEWLVQHGLPWQRHSSARYEYDAEIAWYEPGQPEPRSVAANEDGNALVPVDELRSLLERESVADSLRRLVADLTLPVVPPLRIVPHSTANERMDGIREPRRVHDLSTAHITAADSRLLAILYHGGVDAFREETGQHPLPCYGAHEYGGVFWCGDDESPRDDDLHPWSKELVAVLEFVRRRGCDFVLFDADGPSIPELPVFDW